METIELWARNGDAVREAIELGNLVHLDTAQEELTDEFLLFAIESGLLSRWSDSFPDPRSTPEIGMEVIIASHLAASEAERGRQGSPSRLTASRQGRGRCRRHGGPSPAGRSPADRLV